jgi:hypothetical protein
MANILPEIGCLGKAAKKVRGKTFRDLTTLLITLFFLLFNFSNDSKIKIIQEEGHYGYQETSPMELVQKGGGSSRDVYAGAISPVPGTWLCPGASF